MTNSHFTDKGAAKIARQLGIDHAEAVVSYSLPSQVVTRWLIAAFISAGPLSDGI